MPDASPAAPATPAPSGLDAAVQLLQGTAPQPVGAPPAPPPAPTPVAEKPKEEPRDFGASAFAKAARKERALLDRDRALKAQEATLKAQQAEIEQMKRDLDARMKSVGETEQQRQARRSAYLKNPRLVLEDAGLTYEQLTQAILNDGQLPADAVAQQLEERIQQVNRTVEDRLSALQQAEADRQRQAEESAKAAADRERQEAEAQVRSDISETVKAEPDRYELVTLYGKDAETLVYRAIETHYEETGTVLSYKDACDKVEAYLDGEVEKLAKTKKYAPRFRPKDTPAEQRAEIRPPVSLGNAGAPPTVPSRRPMTREEAMAAAEAALRAAKF